MGAAGAIPTGEILSFAVMANYPDPVHFLRVIRELDAVYLQHITKPRK